MLSAEQLNTAAETKSAQAVGEIWNALDDVSSASHATGWSLLGIAPDSDVPDAVAGGMLTLLTPAMMADDAGRLTASNLAERQVAPCLAMLLKDDQQEANGVMDAADLVFPALAVLERHSGGDEAFGLAHAVVGDRGLPPSEIDLELCGVVVEIDGVPMATGAGAAVLGHPIRALDWFAGALAAAGRSLPAGALVLIGPLAPGVEWTPGNYARVTVGGLGSAALQLG